MTITAMTITGVTAGTLPKAISIAGNSFTSGQYGIELLNMPNQIIGDATVTGANVVINTADGLANLTGYPLNLDNLDNLQVSKLTIGGGGTTHNIAIYTKRCDGVIIQNCNITNRLRGFYISVSSDVQFLNNTLTSTGYLGNYAVQISGITENALPKGLSFLGNTFSGGNYGLFLEDAPNQVIADVSGGSTNVVLPSTCGLNTVILVALRLSNTDNCSVSNLTISGAASPKQGASGRYL